MFLFSKTLVFVVFPREPCLYFPCIFETLCMYKASPLYSGRGPLYQYPSFYQKPLFSLFFLLVELIECWCVISNFWCEYQGAFPQPFVSPFDPHTLRSLSTMAGDQNGKLTKEERLLLKSMNAHLQQMMDNNMGEFQKELRQKFLQQTDDLRQKNKKRMDSQKLEPRSPDSVQNKSSKHKWYKEEEAGRGQQSYKQTGHTSSRPHQASRTPKSNIHSSYNQIVTKPQLYVFTGEGDYLKWERTMEKWLCYNKILKREALAYVMSQLKGNIFKWLLQEEDDRRYYKEPAITTWEDLKLLLRKKYASKGHTSLKSPKKKVISATDFKSEKSETKMADYEKEISSLVKEILKTSKHLDKQKKLPKNQEPVATVSELNDAEPDSAAPIQEAQTKTSMGKGKFEKEQEFSLFLPHSESNFDNSFDELTCLEPVQPSRIVSVSQVAKEDSAEKEPESTTQEEQQKNLQTESAHESLSYDLQEHCKEFNMVAYVPRIAEKCTGKKRGYTDESLAKLEMQQSNLGSCLAANSDIGAVRGSYLSNQKELSNKLNCNGNYTHQGLTSNWNHVQSFSNERVMGSTRRVILCLLCLNFSECRTSQSYLWRPDMMHLFLPKESCADYMEALKNAKRKNKREEDKRFKPPDLSQERHHDGALSLFSLYFRDLVHVQGFSFIFWSWPLVSVSIFLSKTFVFSFLLACRRLRALVWCVISDLLPRSIKEPFRSLLCHHSIHIP
ncbi:hypothetical protein IGI04_042641 [Brassica rapa subsp. trilocularis]|uniref:Retrotransposon gag domain-containing protein n=1 Tax=Brassica rapa subsp. trilocularis TaxID=1813537 RepID=A0ABQ7KHX5_BRACM|nr:hypothetical protein IGI04_042641 [Brassica rapa subsp. trilocularis]